MRAASPAPTRTATADGRLVHPSLSLIERCRASGGRSVRLGFSRSGHVAVGAAGYISRRDRERLHTELAEREDTAASAARRALLDITTERLHIADELGTVIARSIDTIARHAETGSQLIATNDTNAARDTLQTISTISRNALNDLRRLLKHMRSTTAATTYSPIPAPDQVAAFDSVSAPR